MARGDQLSRQWKIIQALIASRRGRSVPELAEMVDCHVRTVYRDLEALQVAGFPVMTERDGHRMIWSLLDPARHTLPIPLSLPELTALYFGLELLDRTQESLAVAVAPAKAHAPYRAMIEVVSQAILQRRRLEMVYRAMHGRADTRRRVAPYRLLFFEGSFYILGHCGLRQDIRVFALDRIRKLDLTDETFAAPAGLNIDEFLKSSFGVFQGPPASVKIRFGKDIAGYITEKSWHPSQKVSTRADGSVIFEAEVAGTEEIKHWVLKWGAKAEVLAPASLRQEIRREAEEMMKTYGRGK
jgi:predicted DNA-binding transcriptional regulator YafY